MNIRRFLFPLWLMTALAFGQTTSPKAADPAPAQPAAPTISSVLDHAWSGVERQIVGAAEAMPEDKYGFAPVNGEFKGVRTFAEQIKHVAYTNRMIFSTMLGEAPPPRDNTESGPAALKTKAEILQDLRGSFALGHRAIAAITPQNVVEPVKSPSGMGTATRLGMVTMVIGHSFDHYGQLVEYLRMNGIIPPASRR
jgi:uncharacterized damage-inducible protein DinB